MGHEKNMSFLVIPKSLSKSLQKKKRLKIELGSFNLKELYLMLLHLDERGSSTWASYVKVSFFLMVLVMFG